jgi:hypothetical protein
LAGFYPEDALDALMVDEAMETMNELMMKTPQNADVEEKKKARKEFQQEDQMTKWFKFLEARIQAAGGQGFVESFPSIADVSLWLMCEGIKSGNWDYIDDTFVDGFPGIM